MFVRGVLAQGVFHGFSIVLVDQLKEIRNIRVDPGGESRVVVLIGGDIPFAKVRCAFG